MRALQNACSECVCVASSLTIGMALLTTRGTFVARSEVSGVN